MKTKLKSKYLKTVGSALAAAGLLSASSAWAGTAFFDFTEDPSLSSQLKFYGAATWWFPGGDQFDLTNGYISITEAVDSQVSTIVFEDIDEGAVVSAFTFEAKIRAGNGEDPPADGFSINYARSNDPILQNIIDTGNTGGPGSSSPAGWAQNQACEANLPEEGTQTGIAIGFDAWNSGSTATCDILDPSIGNDVRAMTIRVDKILVAQFPIPVVNGACEDATSLQTGPISTSNPGTSSGLCWAPLKIELGTNAQLSVWWKNVQILTNYQTAYFPSPGRLIFGGRTGGNNQLTHVDDIRITTITDVADTNAPTAPTALAAVAPIAAGRVELTWGTSTDDSGRVAYEVERNGTLVGGILTTNRFVDTGVTGGTNYTYRVRATDVSANVSDWISLEVSTPAEIQLAGTLKANIYANITGTSIADLAGDLDFPDNPSRNVYVLGLLVGNQNGNAGWNESFGDNYGLRVTGVLTPLETADYDFFIRSDDASQFFLNTTGAAIPDPATATPLVQESGCCNAFPEPGTDEAATAAPVSLTAGQSYGFVMLVKEGGGGDGGAVGMRKVGDTTPAANLPPIQGLLVKGTSDPVGGTLSINRQPANQTTVANQRTEFSVGVTNLSFYNAGVWYQWLKSGTPIPGAIGTSYVIPVTATTDAGPFSVVVGSIGTVITSSVATLTVNADTLKPIISRAGGDSETLDSLLVTFSEPVTAPTATTAGNYAISGGVTVTNATLVDQFNVRLQTSPQAANTPYTLTVNNVADNAANAVEANSVVNFRSWGLVPSRSRGDIFDGISGTSIAALTGDQKWTDNAFDRVVYQPGLLVGSPNGNAGWNGSFGDNFGMRVSSILIPTETAQYHFFIRSDDASQLFLNQTGAALPDPMGTPLIQETGCCATFPEPATADESVTTTPISLTAGQSYGVIVLLKEGGGGDGVGIAMRKVGDTTASANLAPIQSQAYWTGPLVNVLAPNNTIVPTSTNSPAGEQALRAIDGLASTKYLNFDKLNAGFTVTPASASTIKGIALTSANDEVPRDPTSFKLEGSVNGTTYTLIAEGTVAAFPARFVRREYFFNNDAAYTSYRVTFPTVNNATTANSMQIAEVELLGFLGGAAAVTPEGPSLSFTRAANGDLVITFEGTLEGSDTLVGGTWTTVGTTSPQTIPTTGEMRYFRARQ